MIIESLALKPLVSELFFDSKSLESYIGISSRQAFFRFLHVSIVIGREDIVG